jgi:hypothetical protein
MMTLLPLPTASCAAVAFAAALLYVAGTLPAYCENFYLLTDQTVANDHQWNQLEPYNSEPGGDGSPPEYLDSNDLYSNGFQVRTPGGDNLLGDASTTFHLNSKLLSRSGSTEGSTVENLVTYGSSATISAGGSATFLNVINFTNNVTTTLDGDGHDDRVQNLTFFNLFGAGNFCLTGAVRINLDLANATEFTGNFVWACTANSILQFNSTFVSGGGLVVPVTGRIHLDQNVTFSFVSLGGNILEAGTHSYANLKEKFDSIFLETGSGSITVKP